MNREELKYIVIIILTVGAIIGFSIWGIFKLDAYTCYKLAQNIDWETQYQALGGSCLVKQNGRWIPYETIRNINN